MDTFPSLLKANASQRSGSVAVRGKRYGIWNTFTWGYIYNETQKYACGLAAKDIKPGDKLALIGNNIPHFYTIIAAAHSLGAVVIPIHPDTGTEDLRSILTNCGAKLAVVQDQQQVDAIYDVIKDCPKLTEVFFQDERGMQQYDHAHLKSLENLEEAGMAFKQSSPQFYDSVTSKINSDTEAFILYTSGTTDVPKGVVLTNSNFISIAKAFVEREKVTSTDELLAFMPLAYASSMFFNYAVWLVSGCRVNCPESNETILSDMREVGPTVFFGPPHFYKRLYTEMYSRGEASRSDRFQKYIAIALSNRDKFLNGQALSFADKFKTFVGNYIVYGPLKNVYGLTNIRRAYVGGDLMTGQAFNFYRAIGINIKKLYGLTEAAGCVAVQSQAELATRDGEYLIGKPLAGVEVKVLDSGEIAFKGPNAFKEYYNDPQATQAVKQSDGWVHTGDYGQADGKGGIRVFDLMINLGKYATGATYAPKLVEAILKESPYVKNALIDGKDKDQILAIISLDTQAMGIWADIHDLRFSGYTDLIRKPEVHEFVRSLARDVNAKIKQNFGEKLPEIRRVTILHREFRVEAGEFTRSRKIRRDVMMSHYQSVFDALRSSEKEHVIKTSTGAVTAKLSLVDVS